MNAIRVALLWLSLMVTTGYANTPVEIVRTLLDAGDVAGLEREMKRLDQQVVVSGNADDLRQIEARLFETSHPDRIKVIEAWRTAYPDSIYSLAAETWVAIKAVELWGSDYNRYEQPKTNEENALWRKARTRALSLADLLAHKEATFVPAIDAWLRTKEITRGEFADLERQVSALMEVAPNRESVLRIVEAVHEWSLNPAHDVVGVCLDVTELAVDYDADRCVVEAAILRHLQTDLRAAAEEQLPSLKDPRLVAARFSVLFRSRPTDSESRARLLSLHRRLLTIDTDLVEYVRDARAVAHFAEEPEYVDQAKQNVLSMIDLRLVDDPLNHNLLLAKSELMYEAYTKNGSEVLLENARKHWEDAMYYGKYSDIIWRLGALLAIADKEPYDFVSQKVFLENTIAYSGQNVQYILENLFALNQAEDAALSLPKTANVSVDSEISRVLEDIKCPILKAAKLASALCRTTAAGFPLCDPSKPFFERVPAILAEGKNGSCPSVSDIPLSKLRYEAVGIENIELPW